MSNSIKQETLVSKYRDRSIPSRNERRDRETAEDETIRFALSNGGRAAIQREEEEHGS